MNEPRRRFKAAVIGLGFIGAGDPIAGQAIGQSVAGLDGTHAQVFAEHPQVELVSGADLDAGRRSRFEQRQGLSRTYADYREMLAVEKPDIVSVATHAPLHADMVIAAAEAGARAVLCEKPLATRLSDGDRAVQACRARGVMVSVNHSRRWHPLWNGVRDEIRGGAIGVVHHAVAHWPTGRFGNVGTHLFDVLRLLLGVEAVGVSGVLDPVVPADCRGPQYHDPGGWGVVAFSGDIKAFIDASQSAKFPLAVRVVGSLGQVMVRGAEARFELWAGGERTFSPPKTASSSLALALDEIVRCLAGGGESSSTIEDGLAALEMIVGFHVSSRLRGQWVPLPVAGADRDLEVRSG